MIATSKALKKEYYISIILVFFVEMCYNFLGYTHIVVTLMYKKLTRVKNMTEYAPGMRLIIRDEEWMIKEIDTYEIGAQALNCIGISPLAKEKNYTAYIR